MSKESATGKTLTGIRAQALAAYERAGSPKNWDRDENRRILGSDLGMGRGREIVVDHVHPDNAPLIEMAPRMARSLFAVLSSLSEEQIAKRIHAYSSLSEEDAYEVAETVMALLSDIAEVP